VRNLDATCVHRIYALRPNRTQWPAVSQWMTLRVTCCTSGSLSRP
jgi:hypothetical protein